MILQAYAYGRSLDDGAGLDDFLLVQLGTRAVQVADNRGHTSLVAHGSRQVDGLLRVILGEAGHDGELGVELLAAATVITS